MNLAGTTLLNGLATAARLACGLLLNKLLALYLGPTGFGVIGQFQSLLAMAGALGGGALGAGVTKLTAEHAADPPRQAATWRTALLLSTAASGLCAAVLVVAARPLAARLLGDATLHTAVWVLAAALAGIVLNTLLLATLSGLKAVRAFVAASVAGSVVSLVVAYALVSRWGLHGALAALAAGQAAGLVGTLACAPGLWRGLVRRLLPPSGARARAGVDAQALRSLSGFALMAATSAIVVPLAQITIRHGITQFQGPDVAGLWQALMRLSDTHLLLLTTTLSLYFLPRFAEIRDGAELRREVNQGYRFVLPLVCTTAGVSWLLREPLVALLFSAEFLPLTPAWGWQLVGDVLKIASWVPAFTMISHARTRLFITTEVCFAALMTLLILLGTWLGGLHGAAMGYAATFALYWLVTHRQLVGLTRHLGSGRDGAGRPQ